MSREKVIGRSVPRVESVEKVTGRAVYAVDVSFPNMLWGKVLRSPIAYGRIKRIDVTKALALPGVKAVVTGLDVVGVRDWPANLRHASARRRCGALRRRKGSGGCRRLSGNRRAGAGEN